MQAHGASLKSYFIIFAALMFLLFATVAAAYFHLGILSILVMLAIAITKATLIVLYFMHVRYRSGLIWIFAAGGFYWFLVLIGLIFTDYATRAPWRHSLPAEVQPHTQALQDDETKIAPVE